VSDGDISVAHTSGSEILHFAAGISNAGNPSPTRTLTVSGFAITGVAGTTAWGIIGGGGGVGRAIGAVSGFTIGSTFPDNWIGIDGATGTFALAGMINGAVGMIAPA